MGAVLPVPTMTVKPRIAALLADVLRPEILRRYAIPAVELGERGDHPFPVLILGVPGPLDVDARQLLPVGQTSLTQELGVGHQRSVDVERLTHLNPPVRFPYCRRVGQNLAPGLFLGCE